ncbi:hypothetical protein [Niveibacterium terrae]|uniref:hypothetical protein n=1 Tax=Niveibacterium terrae TaxID=3373598 RepID=UPI003A93F2E9
MKALSHALVALAVMLLASASFAGNRPLCDLVDEQALEALSLEGAQSSFDDSLGNGAASCTYKKPDQRLPVLIATFSPAGAAKPAAGVRCKELQAGRAEHKAITVCFSVLEDGTLANWSLIRSTGDKQPDAATILSAFERLSRRKSAEAEVSAAAGAPCDVLDAEAITALVPSGGHTIRIGVSQSEIEAGISGDTCIFRKDDSLRSLVVLARSFPLVLKGAVAQGKSNRTIKFGDSLAKSDDLTASIGFSFDEPNVLRCQQTEQKIAEGKTGQAASCSVVMGRKVLAFILTEEKGAPGSDELEAQFKRLLLAGRLKAH